MGKLIVTRFVDIDIPVGSLDDIAATIAAYQSTYKGKGAYILEKWSGYEDNYFVIQYDEEETDEEFNARLQQEQIEKKWKEDEEAEERESHNKKIQNQIASLQKKIKK